MRKSLVVMIISVFLIGPAGLMCKEGMEVSLSQEIRIPATKSLLFNNVIILLQKAGALAGTLVGIDGDAVVILRKGQEEKIPWRDMKTITIEVEKNRRQGILMTMLAGIYLGNVLVLRDKSQPSFYIGSHNGDSAWWYVWNEAIIVGASSGLAFLLGGLFGQAEKTFEFTGSEKEDLRKWEAFKKFILGTEGGPKIHLSAQGAWVFPKITNRYRSLFQDAGYNSWRTQYYYGGQDLWPTSEFNMLRKIQLTYSIRPDVEIGAAVCFLGEPSLYGEKQISYQVYDPYGNYWYTSSQFFYVNQSLSSTGYFVVGVYKPFLKTLPKILSWNVGLGLGVSQIKLLTTVSDLYYDAYGSPGFEISKAQFCSLLFTELKLYLWNALSFGLTADYTLAPALQAPALPDVGIPAQKLRVGNGSIGFTLGFHF
jgi:hypothetical protein